MEKMKNVHNCINRALSQEEIAAIRARDIIIVGAGVSGLTAARILAEAGKRVCMIEQRGTVGGNLYDYTDENNVTVQKYGPHIFHTNDKAVYDFLTRFTAWHPYEHRVLALIDGKTVPVPFNLTSLHALYPEEQATKIGNLLIAEYGLGQKVTVVKLKEHPNPTLRAFGEFVYQKVFAYYTQKQWGCKIEDLDEAVASRVPVYVSHDNRYFTDTYQCQPEEGFTKLAERMLSHPAIECYLGVDALPLLKAENIMYFAGEPYRGKVIFTGRVDELFAKKHGALPYRSLQFSFETHDFPSYQDAAVINYTTSERFTRISEFSKFCCPVQKKTVIVKEYPKACGENDVPYYPIPKAEYRATYEKYRAEAEKIANLHLLGRLACYRYLNTDAAVKEAMKLANRIINE